jgi:hypothetical protein
MEHDYYTSREHTCTGSPQSSPRRDGWQGRDRGEAAAALCTGASGRCTAGAGRQSCAARSGLATGSPGHCHQRRRACTAQPRVHCDGRAGAPHPRLVAHLDACASHRAGAGRHLCPAAEAPSRPRLHQGRRRTTSRPCLERLRLRCRSGTAGAEPPCTRGDLPERRPIRPGGGKVSASLPGVARLPVQQRRCSHGIWRPLQIGATNFNLARRGVRR